MSWPRPLRPPRPVAPLLVSALLLGVAFPPFHLLVPSFVALAPFAVWTARLPAGEAGRSRALRGGFLLGLVYFSLVLYWLVVSLIFYTPLAVLAFLLPVLILSGMLAVAALGVHQARHRLGMPVWVALPLFWTAMEWTRAHLGDVSFPWMQLGDSLTGFPWLIGAADVVGSRGMSFWLALCSGLVAEALLRWRPAAAERWLPDPAGEEVAGGRRTPPPGASGVRPAIPLALLALAITVPAGYSLWRWSSLETRPAARVAVYQPNIPEDLKLRPGAAIDSTVTAIRTLTRGALGGAGELDLALLPEATFPSAVLDPLPSRGYRGRPDLKAFVSGVARELEAPVLYGGVGSEDRPGGDFLHYNSAFLRSPDGRRLGSYHKRELVPVIERVPFVDPAWFQGWFADVFGPYFGGASVGPRPELLSTDGARFGVLICYESIFTELARDYRLRGADFLVNVTNDAWYGRETPAWSRTSALWQHPAHLVMRAVENRVGIARSANTGISLMVDPLGRVSHRTPLFEPVAFTATVRTAPGPTLYARWGDVPGTASALAVLGVALACGWRMRGGPSGAG